MVGNKSVTISRIDIKTELISDPQTGQADSSISMYRLLDIAEIIALLNILKNKNIKRALIFYFRLYNYNYIVLFIYY